MRDSAEILHQGYLGNVTMLRDLQHLAGLTTRDAAAACLVSPATFRRWRSDRAPNPTAVRLLAILSGYLPWHGWHGWEMHSGYLFPPGYDRNGLTPGEVLAMPFVYQLLADFRRRSRAVVEGSARSAEPLGLSL